MNEYGGDSLQPER